MCDHNDGLQHIYLGCFDCPGYEIYMCECGALVNVQDKRNYTGDEYVVMTPEDIEMMMLQILRDYKSGLMDKISRAIKDE